MGFRGIKVKYVRVIDRGTAHELEKAVGFWTLSKNVVDIQYSFGQAGQFRIYSALLLIGEDG